MSVHKSNLSNLLVDRSWTLFLDRDGVMNKRLIDDYVKHWQQFEFLPGVLDAMKGFGELFGRIFIVTNQQGIGKGLMTETDLAGIHMEMTRQIELAGGRIDRVYYCPALAEDQDVNRKPLPGMAWQAQADFSGVDPEKGVMVGDSESDMEFGRNAGLFNVFIGPAGGGEDLVDARFDSLFDFYQALIHS